jgi:hypothetical protein
MDHPTIDAAHGRPRRSVLPLILIPLLAFVAGVAAMGWLLTRWDQGAAMLGVAPQAAPAAAQPTPQPQVVVQPEPATPTPEPQEAERLVIDPEITRRVNVVEQRLAQLDQQSRQAVGNADRAEGLLVAFAARRALDRGVALGYIESLLRERFGARHPQAVATVLTAARQPVTLADLQKGLQDTSRDLTGGSAEQSWWRAFKTEIGGLVRLRREGAPSQLPSDRLRRATQNLEAGQVDLALLEVLRMPGRDKAADWIAMTRRYVAARRALDALETAALLEPRQAPQAVAQLPAVAAPR